MIKEDMKEEEFHKAYKAKLLETFDFLIGFFNQHNLQWWGAYGTCIGAVRHQGLIPWDDDIDVYMPREDYEKFIELREDVKSNGYDLLSIQDKGCCNVFYKICNMSTSLIGEKNIPFDTGVFIDIFPLDYFDGNERGFNKLHERYRRWASIYKFLCMKPNFHDTMSLLSHFKLYEFLKYFIRLLTPDSLQAYSKSRIEKIERLIVNPKKGQFIASFCGRYGLKELYKSKWFEGYELMDYEGRKMRVPLLYHDYLTYVYGDYMKYPDVIPEFTHSQYYVNLNNRVDVDDIYNRVKQGITKEW